MSLIVSIATRNRPQQLVATLARDMKCFSRSDTLVVIQADADDWATIGILSSLPPDPRVKINIQPREDTVAGKWNRGLKEDGDVFLNASDDDVYVTPDTDEKILQAAALFPDGIGMIYGRNANASFPGVIAYTRQWANHFNGVLQPEYFPYWFADHWTDDIGRIIQRISFADVTTDQSGAGKTQELREPGWWATWFDAAYLMRRAQAQKIINNPAFDVPQWQKDIMLRHHPRVEYYSKWVNETVRQQSRQLEGMMGNQLNDPRYQRVKQAAIAMLPHLLDDYGMEKAEANHYRELLAPPNVIAALPRAFG
jgi:hypothetical protein